MTIRPAITALQSEIAACRREMHQNPQTAYEETFAAGLVAKKLKEWSIPFESGIAVTGLVATIKGQKPGRTIALRADMDALDIIEENNKPWVSKTPGKMHGCGHDGHTAMLLGAAKYLNDTRNFSGTVHLIFQPAEEGKRGAHKMIEEGLFSRFPCDEVYGLHNWPEMPRGKAGMRAGPIMAASDQFDIKITGRGGHAAMPHLSIDPVLIGSTIITALQSLVSRERAPLEPAVISITNFKSGTGAYNVIPDTAHLMGTLRTYDQTLRHRLKDRIGEVASGIAKSFGATIDYQFNFVLDPTINDASATEFCARIAQDLLGPENVDTNVTPCMGGEDFGAMLLERPGCYIWLGQGEPADAASTHNYGLHTPRYDFNDEIIPLGMEYWVRVAESALPPK